MQFVKEKKQKDNKRTKVLIQKILWVFYAIFSIVIWLPKADSMLISNYEEASKCVELNDSWYVQIRGQEYYDVTLEDFSFDSANKGEQFVLERTLPAEFPFENGSLRVNLKHSALRIFIDQEMVYEYGFDRIAHNKSVGSGIIFIKFPDTYAGKKIRMEFQVDEDSAFSAFDPFHIYAAENAIQVHLSENRIPMFLGVFLFVFGLFSVILTIFVVLLSPKYVRLSLISAFAICMGLWTLCFYDIFTIFTIPLYSIGLIEYMVLYLAPIFIIGYMYGVAKQLGNKMMTMLYWIILGIQFVFVSTCITLHTLDVIHCAATLPYLLILVVIALVYLFVLLTLNFIKREKNNMQTHLYFLGILILMIGLAFDIGSYSIKRYFGINIPQLKGVSPLAIIIFVIILIYIFFLDITEKLMHEKEREILIHSAYYDELTEIHNRRYCSEYMNKIEESDMQTTAVLCFDVNNLKIVNDMYGHAAGDLLIIDSSAIIKKTFENYGIVGRMGGDEFIAILTINDNEKLAELLEEFRNNIRKNNKSTKNFPVSIAVGAAYGKDEQVKNLEKMYHIADQRMYENKKEIKQKEKK